MTVNPLDLIVPAFIAFRDTITGARKRSKEELRSWFTTHVEPVDNLMREIYDDYSKGFGILVDLLTSGAAPSEAVDLLKELRLEKVRDRADVEATAEALADARKRRLLGRGLGEDFYGLYVAVDDFTVAADPGNHLSFYSTFIQDFERIIADGKDPRDQSFYTGSSR